MPIRIVSVPVSLDELRRMTGQQFGDFVKAVVDIGRGVIAIGGELHADEEEFDSMINVRPSHGNRSRGVEDATVRRQIQDIVERLVVP